MRCGDSECAALVHLNTITEVVVKEKTRAIGSKRNRAVFFFEQFERPKRRGKETRAINFD